MTHRMSRAILRNNITRYYAIKYPLPILNNYAHRACCSDFDQRDDKPRPFVHYTERFTNRAHTHVFLNNNINVIEYSDF